MQRSNWRGHWYGWRNGYNRIAPLHGRWRQRLQRAWLQYARGHHRRVRHAARRDYALTWTSQAALHLLDDHLIGAAMGKALLYNALLNRPLQRQRPHWRHCQSFFTGFVCVTHAFLNPWDQAHITSVNYLTPDVNPAWAVRPHCPIHRKTRGFYHRNRPSGGSAEQTIQHFRRS